MWLFLGCISVVERDFFKAQTAFQSFEWIRMDVSRTRWLVRICHMSPSLLLSLSLFLSLSHSLVFFSYPPLSLFSFAHCLFLHYWISEMSALRVLPSWEDEGWNRHRLFSLWSPLLFLVFFLFHPAVRNFLSPWFLRRSSFPICILLMTMGKNLSSVVFDITLFCLVPLRITGRFALKKTFAVYFIMVSNDRSAF